MFAALDSNSSELCAIDANPAARRVGGEFILFFRELLFIFPDGTATCTSQNVLASSTTGKRDMYVK